MQILTTEHWSLLASRGLAWNESFSRASMYLSTLSGAMVALGLVAGITSAGPIFDAFALVILPVVLFIGVATFIRMGAANYHDALAVMGMNRIRGAYLELAPDLAPYFVMGAHDDPPGIEITMAVPRGSSSMLRVISATPFVIGVLNGIVGGGIAAVAAAGLLDVGLAPTLLVGAITFGVTMAIQLRVVRGNMRRGRSAFRPLFPTPSGGGPQPDAGRRGGAAT
jgi:hypothetical protein